MSKKTSKIDWSQTISRWKQSGLSQRKFCVEAKISLSTLRYHLKNNRQRTGFIELSEPFSIQALSSPIEVILPSTGLTIRIQQGFCRETLRELLEALAEGNHVR
jgi:lambda repressor-like predicted transcriptional regulator